jgi:outer membrane protein TolC
LPLTGCTRTRYRLAADEEVAGLVRQNMDDPRWCIQNYTVEQDPRSRSYDPWNRDFPPMPPDDPTSHRYMHCVDGMHGWARWHENGDIEQLENPYWMQYLPQYTERAPDGTIRVGLDDCVHLSIIHDPDYQTQLETLYLCALDVSTQRFQFDVQFNGNSTATFQTIGSDLPNGPSNNVTLASGLTIQKEFASAAQLMIGFANSTVWNFAGPNSGFTTSLLNFSLIQPLLQGGGRVIALEELTIAERNLLYNVKSLVRYRQGNFTNVAIGELAVSTLSRAGGFFGGTGLTGFTGTGASGFGGVGDITGFARTSTVSSAGGGTGSASGFAGGGAGTVGGFAGLLQQITQIRNSQETLNAETRTLALLEANLDAGFIDIAQVDQFRQNIETERANLLQARENLQLSMDTFKAAQMGLPPSLEISLDESLIRPFEFLDPRLSDLQNRISDDINAFGLLPKNPPLNKLRQAVDAAQALQRRLAAHYPVIRNDLKKLDLSVPDREKSMTAAEKQQFAADRSKMVESLSALEARLKANTESVAAVGSGLTEQTRQPSADRLVALLVDLSNIAGEMVLVQSRARLERIAVEMVHLEPKEALEIARANRLDWQNARASMVDTWRLIEFNANALQAGLTVTLNGSIQTPGHHDPFDFRGELGQASAAISYSPPLTRLTQRNSWRQQLIDYQQNRRAMLTFEDGVSRNVRQLLRDMRQLRINLEIQRRAVAIAIRRVDQTRELLSKPAPPTPAGATPTQLGPTAALNLLTALSDLRNTENNFISIWINYWADRMRLLREMGLMQTDETGVWIEESIADAVRRSGHQDEPLPPDVPAHWLQEGAEPPPTAAPVQSPVQTPATSPPAQAPSGRAPSGPPPSGQGPAIPPPAPPATSSALPRDDASAPRAVFIIDDADNKSR